LDYPKPPAAILDLPGVDLSGQVVPGDGRGRRLGFPTANLAVSGEHEALHDGVYCCLVQIAGEAGDYGGTASIGNNPTFEDVNERRVEVYLHDFDRAIYGRKISIRLIKKIRDMQRFSGLETLREQTARDVTQSRAILSYLCLS